MNRYERFGPFTRWTRNRLAASPQFQTLVNMLRSEGWLDWQIMSVVFSIVHSSRVYRDGSPQSEEEYEQRSRRWFGEEQRNWPVVPVEAFSEQEMREMRGVSVASSLQVWDLVLRQLTPDFPAIERFLSVRYGYGSDDIEHPDPFLAVTS